MRSALSETAETQLGISLKALGKVMGPVGVYVAAEDAWSQFQAGDAVATLLSAGGVGLGLLSASIELAAASPHPAIKVAIALTGVALAIFAKLTTDEEEQFLEQYRPRCEHSGAYVDARNAVAAIERLLNEMEWANRTSAAHAQKLRA